MDNSKTILAKNIRYLMEQKQKTRTELCDRVRLLPPLTISKDELDRGHLSDLHE